MTSPRGARAVVSLLVLLVLGGIGQVLTASSASAHASLESTSPADGARLDAVPEEVVLTFDEAVGLSAGYVRVLGPGGEQVDAGDVSAQDQRVTVALPGGLPEGSYVVTYRVLSADSHPVTGAYAFVVGSGELVPATTVELGSAVAPAVATALPVSKWLGYLGIVLSAGTAVFLVTCWPSGWSRRRTAWLLRSGVALLGVSGATGFLLQGPYAAGAGLGSVLDPTYLAISLDSVYGYVLLVRLVLAVLLWVVSGQVLRHARAGGPPRRVGSLVTGAVLLTGSALTLTVVGHAVAGAWPVLAVLSNTAHLAAMAVWIGGLAVLAVAVLPRGEPTAAGIEQMTVALTRFSRIALGAVGVLVATGVFQSVREVGSFTGLFTTTYGWLLVAKLGVFLVVLALAAVARDWVQQHGRSSGALDPTPVSPTPVDPAPLASLPASSSGPAGGVLIGAPPEAAHDVVRDRRGRPVTADHVRAVRRSLLVEVTLAVAVLAVTAVLTGTPPAGSVVTQPVDVTLDLPQVGLGSVQVSLAPGRVGTNSLDVYLYDAGGALYDPQEVTARLVERQQAIGPLDVEVERAGVGRYGSDAAAVPLAGTWTLTVTVRVDEFTSAAVSHEFAVR